MNTLILTDITKHYHSTQGTLTILDGVSLTVEPGETVAIVGPSGSGKSTLLNIIGSLDKPTSGTARFGDIDVTTIEGKSLAEFRAARVGFIFQDHHLLPQLTALENVLLPTASSHAATNDGWQCSTDGWRFPNRHPKASPGSPYPAAITHARDLLERVGIAHRSDAFPARMSGGERQRVAIARALINSPGLLLCDEPTGNLDRESGEVVVSLLLELACEQNTTVLMVTHNAAHAARFARRMRLEYGRLIAEAGEET